MTSIRKLVSTVNSSVVNRQPREEKMEGRCHKRWKKGELKLFVWVVIFYCFVHDKSIESLVKIILFRATKTIYLLGPSSPILLFSSLSMKH